VGTGQLHGVKAHAHTLGRCIAPCLFNFCKLIDFRIYCFIASINIGMNMSTLHTLMCIN